MGGLKLKSLGIRIHNFSMVECVKIIDFCVQQKTTKLVFTPNTDHLRLMQKNKAFHHSYLSADLLVPDGMPIVWLSKILTPKLKERVAGVDLVFQLCKLANEKGYSVLFIGGPENNVRMAKNKLTKIFPNLELLTNCPSYNIDEEENKGIVQVINKVSPDILLIGLGAPKQELWLTRHKHLLKAKVCLGVGGSFDMISGCKKRAPKTFQMLGLEWLFRISQDLKLSKRYFFDFLFFTRFMLKELFVK